MFKAAKTNSNMIKDNQQMLDLLLKETSEDIGKWSETQYKKEVKKGVALFKAIKRSF